MPHGTRLYSIAATRYGDKFDGQTTSLCVRRATFWDSEKNAEDPEKKGICSNFLCDAKPGDEIKMTGETYLPATNCNAHRDAITYNTASLMAPVCTLTVVFAFVSAHLPAPVMRLPSLCTAALVSVIRQFLGSFQD